ncbi:MAG: hypothetical protein ABH950_05650, partial [Candidatus Altiarchaeota archaeon]
SRAKQALEKLVSEHSEDADLVIAGFSLTKLEEQGLDFFKNFNEHKDILFVSAEQKIKIIKPAE